jgi:hypothetical protein
MNQQVVKRRNEPRTKQEKYKQQIVTNTAEGQGL